MIKFDEVMKLANQDKQFNPRVSRSVSNAALLLLQHYHDALLAAKKVHQTAPNAAVYVETVKHIIENTLEGVSDE